MVRRRATSRTPAGKENPRNDPPKEAGVGVATGEEKSDVSRDTTKDPEPPGNHHHGNHHNHHHHHKRRLPVKTLLALIMFFGALLWAFFFLDEAVDRMQHDVIPTGLLVDEPNRPGLKYKALLNSMNRTVKIRRPVVIIPGFVTTHLELWGLDTCLRRNITSGFRQRMFGAQMLLELVTNPECYLKHMSLGPKGSDPNENIKVRPAEGFDAADYLVPAFWVWAKVLINLADIGFDPTYMHMASFDWRLSPSQMEERDGYFLALKHKIEYLTRRSGQKVVVPTHSYGALVFTEFLRWIEDVQRNPNWTEAHIHSFFNIGGPLLGMSKALAGLLSGEFKDTAKFPAPMKMLLNAHVPLEARAATFRSWPCLHAMLPTLAAAWPNLITVLNTTDNSVEHLDFPESLRLLTNTFMSEDSPDLTDYITSSLARRSLPMLPNPRRKSHMRVYCVYGVDYESESGYYYKTTLPGGMVGVERNSTFFVINDEADNSGVKEGNGDGTVPLHSLGYLCRSKKHGWPQVVADPSLVKTIQFPNHLDDPATVARLDPRGGEFTGDHVDIMGNSEMLTMLLHTATGNEDLITERIITPELDEMTERLDQFVSDAKAGKEGTYF